jgi:hypothetical protein
MGFYRAASDSNGGHVNKFFTSSESAGAVAGVELQNTYVALGDPLPPSPSPLPSSGMPGCCPHHCHIAIPLVPAQSSLTTAPPCSGLRTPFSVAIATLTEPTRYRLT